MNDAAWERLADSIDARVGIDRHGRDSRPLEDRPELTEQVEYIEFKQSGHKLRLERVTGPAIIDRKTHFSHRAGAAKRIENVYDEHEQASRVALLRHHKDGWEEVNIAELQF
jgi:hypothetical protein